MGGGGGGGGRRASFPDMAHQGQVRELVNPPPPPDIGLIPKAIPIKIFLDMVPSSTANVTRALRGCFRGG